VAIELGGFALVLTMQDDGTPDQYDLPPPSTSGALAAPTDAEVKANGGAREDDGWSKVGWAPRFGSGDSKEEKEDETNLLDHQTFLESKLDDKFFGGMGSLPEIFSLLD
jgi:hypothetical protein